MGKNWGTRLRLITKFTPVVAMSCGWGNPNLAENNDLMTDVTNIRDQNSSVVFAAVFMENGEKLEEARTHRSAKTHAGTVFCDS